MKAPSTFLTLSAELILELLSLYPDDADATLGLREAIK